MGKKLINPLLEVINKKSMLINPYMIQPSFESFKVTRVLSGSVTVRMTLVFTGQIWVDWKDGSPPEELTSNVQKLHTYAAGGTYTSEIYGNISGITSVNLSSSNVRSITNLKTGNLTYFGMGNTVSYIGSIDMSLAPISGTIRLNSSTNASTVIFSNTGNGLIYSFRFDSSNFDYIDFTKGGMHMNGNNSTLLINNNNMSVADVNHILYDLDSTSASGYTGRVINIGGTNADPDSSSGGYDGVAARNSLIAKGFTVTIT